ncbi:MAG: lipopolysaccharide biosynthesis protein, partial [Thermoguttaceae bacterium]
STLLFGEPDRSEQVTLIAFSLAATIAYFYFLDLFGALRNARLLAVIQMVNGVLFAVLGVVLLIVWRCDATSVVMAFGVSSAACAVIGAAVAWRAWPPMADGGDRRQPMRVWAKVLPFVAWISLANFMGSMFDVADRYLILHFSRLSPSESLAQIGLYHSCRVVPLLLVSVVAMAASIITPHLAHDWERGRRDLVDLRMQMLLKLFGFGLTATCVCILHGAPLLFGVALQGKFHGAAEILPWTLAYCCWFALFGLLQNYVWCCEKAYTSTVALAAGLGLNAGLNMLLLPRLGLFGAVLSTAAANIVALAILFCFCGRMGLKLERSTWIAIALPVSVCLGPWLATLVLGAVALEAATGTFLLNADEKLAFADGTRRYLQGATTMASRLRGSHAT